MITAVLLLWGIGGASIYVAYFVETPAEFALTAETAENRDVYAAYIEGIPAWAIAVGIAAALTRLLGAIFLLLRRAWAVPLFVASAFLFFVAFCRAFAVAGAAGVMSGAHVAIELLFLALGVFAIWFARRSRSTGILA